MQAHSELIQRFYRAFQQRDAAAMAACYHPEIHFSDPAFPELRGPAAGAMWAMLCARGKDLRVEFSDIVAERDTGRAHWDAHYTFSATKRLVHNKIAAQFAFREGKIIRHVDSFSFWRWSRQALGPVGWVLGWTPFLQSKVQRSAAASLAAWRAALLLLFVAFPIFAQHHNWAVHSLERPKPPIATPRGAESPAPPPSDAIVLFEGGHKDLSEWRHASGAPARWTLGADYIEVAAGTGAIETVRAFGDVQLHIEWQSPAIVRGDGQGRGNSGVFLMGRYEIQILDSYQNETYADGQAAALYGQHPPLANASRPPGEWQSYDIVFRRPRFADDGTLLLPAIVTVLHNGVVVHDSQQMTGATAHMRRAVYEAHADRLPISLQDHGDRVRFRNIWVRELP